jgi:hypothetical protein
MQRMAIGHSRTGYPRAADCGKGMQSAFGMMQRRRVRVRRRCGLPSGSSALCLDFRLVPKLAGDGILDRTVRLCAETSELAKPDGPPEQRLSFGALFAGHWKLPKPSRGEASEGWFLNVRDPVTKLSLPQSGQPAIGAPFCTEFVPPHF